MPPRKKHRVAIEELQEDTSVRIIIKCQASTTDAFSLLNWNVLAQELMESHAGLYSKCNSCHLNWKYRLSKIFGIIHKHEPDIFCLQEVTAPCMTKLITRFKLYDSLYVRRTNKPDGCAMFFKKDRFELIHSRIIHFDQIDYRLRGNAAIIAVLKCRMTRRHVMIATTHLLWNPKQGQGKLDQLNALFEKMEDLIIDEHYQDLPIILCGDLNIVYDSFLFRYIVNGETEDWMEPRYMSGQIDNDCRTSTTDKSQQTLSYSHPFHFESVYKQCHQSMSTVVDGKGLVVDHIFFGSHRNKVDRSVRLVEYLGLPELNDSILLPNETNPSDHVPLYAAFSL